MAPVNGAILLVTQWIKNVPLFYTASTRSKGYLLYHHQVNKLINGCVHKPVKVKRGI